MNQAEIKTNIQIQKPANEVFEAIVNPEKMSGYFLEKGSGRLEEGKAVQWKWPEFDEEATIKGEKIEQDKFVSFYWDGAEGVQTLVEIHLETQTNGDTKVTVFEKSMENNEKGIQWLRGNSEGWGNFLACLKAYLEYGINLRKGAFDFMRK